MKIGIVSDSHSLVRELNDLQKRHEKEVSMWIHCGDSELEKTQLESFHVVKGNCDFVDFPKEQCITPPFGQIFVTHGHHYQVKSSLIPLKYKSQEVNAKVVCFGHTHVAMAELVEDVLFINPGSIQKPRIRVEKTYCILNWDETGFSVHFYDITGQEMIDMQRTYHIV